MLSKKDLLVAILCTFCLTMVLFTAAPVKSTGSNYDPWVDTNHDGKINVLDLIKVALSMDTTGDPALNVTVANWPTATETAIWWNQTVSIHSLSCPPQSAGGFSYLHVLAGVKESLGSDTIYINVVSQMWNLDHTYYIGDIVYTAAITSSQQWIGFTIPVPSQSFYFNTVSSANTHYVNLNYYLTWG